MKTKLALLLIAVSAAVFSAAQEYQFPSTLKAKYANEIELASTNLATGELVMNEEKAGDLRMGDDTTPGGVSVGTWLIDYLHNDDTLLHDLGGATADEIKAFVALSIAKQQTEQDDDDQGGPLFPDFVSVNNAWNSYTRHTYDFRRNTSVGNVLCDTAFSEYVNYVNLDWSSITNFRSSNPSLTTNDVRFVSSDNISVQVGDPLGLDVGKYPPATNIFGAWWNDLNSPTGYWGCAIGNYTSVVPLERKYAGFKQETNYVYQDAIGLRGEIDDTLQAARIPTGKSMAPFKTVNVDGVYTTGIGSLTAFSNAVIHYTTNLAWNPDLWCYGVIDLSPVSFGWIDEAKVGTASWQFDQHATLITPQHIVTASHWHAPVGKKLVFLDRNNNVHYRTLTKAVSKKTFTGKEDRDFGDLCVGMLDSPILDIEPAKILHPDDYGKLLLSVTNISQPGFQTQTPRAIQPHMGTTQFMGYVEAVHFRLNAVRDVWFHLDAIEPTHPETITGVSLIDAKTNSLYNYYTYGGDWGRYGKYVNTNNYNFVGGDSSTPILIPINGQTVVTHCLWSSDGSGPNLSFHRDVIEDQLRAWGGSYTTLPRLDLSGWPDVSNP